MHERAGFSNPGPGGRQQPQQPQQSSGPLFPAEAKSLNRPESSAASSSLNATVYLLNRYGARTPSESPDEVQDPFAQPSGQTSKSAGSVMASTTSSSSPPKRRKLCFVTVGATAPFDGLVKACRSDDFLSALNTAGYTNLLIQHGHRGHTDVPEQVGNVRVTSFDFRNDSITREMLASKGDIKRLRAESRAASRQEGAEAKRRLDGLDLGDDWQNVEWDAGVVISHAGSGSILDALRTSVPLIVVPNQQLLDNHQAELAEELARQGYVVHGRLDNLVYALEQAEAIRQKRKQWPPPLDPDVDPAGKGLIGIMDEEMGYRDLKDASRRGAMNLD